MRTLHWYDYAIVRVVPRPEREEFINAGVIVCCTALRWLSAEIALDESRLLALDAGADLGQIRGHLASLPLICAGGTAAGALGRLSQRQRFDWLVAPRSAVIQTSCVHSGACSDPLQAMTDLMRRSVHRIAVRDAH